MNEWRLAIRRLGMRPAAALASILTLAFSIGAAAATWSLLSSVLIHPLPVQDPDRLVVIGRLAQTGRDAGTVQRGLSYPLHLHLRDSGIFERVAAEWGPPMPLLAGTGTEAAAVSVAFASHDLFDLLGVRVPLGRTFDAADDRRGAPPVAILTDRYWRRAFEASPDVLGRSIVVAGKPVTIVGVAPPRYRGLSLAEAPDLFLPLHTVADVASPLTNYFAEPNHASSPTWGVTVIGRLPTAVTIAQVNARLANLPPPAGVGPTPSAPNRVAPRLAAIDVNTNAIPPPVRPGMTRFTQLLGATVGLLLLIGCATVGLLLLVRTEARRGELAMCLALGASRARLVRGIACEGALLALTGALLALPVTSWLLQAVRLFQLPGRVEIDLLDLGLDAPALSVAAVATLLAATIITLIAGTFGYAADVGDALQSRAGATPRVTRRATRATLVAAQVAVALVLLAGAGLFTRSLIAALSLNPTLDTARLLTTPVSVAPYGYTPARATTFFDDLFERLRHDPTIGSAAFSLPQGGMTSSGRLVVNGVPTQFPTMVDFVAIDDRYFTTIGVRLTAGRAFSADDGPRAELVAIVSESMGRIMSDGGNPLGRRITMPFHRPGQAPADVRVVGVVADVIVNVTVAEPLVIYFPLAQQPASPNRLVTIRAAGEAEVAARTLASAVRQVDRAVTPGPILTMEERLGQQMNAQRFGALVLGALGAMAALLTVLGTYVLAESMAALRLREMGIRAALGATRWRLGAIVLAETGKLVSLGLLAGLAGAWMGAATIQALLFRVQPLDPLTLTAVSAGILGISLAVSLRPAIRAARVDLASVLKAE